ncbi:hypothetical protein [Georgenia sp. MJ170]
MKRRSAWGWFGSVVGVAIVVLASLLVLGLLAAGVALVWGWVLG